MSLCAFCFSVSPSKTLVSVCALLLFSVSQFFSFATIPFFKLHIVFLLSILLLSPFCCLSSCLSIFLCLCQYLTDLDCFILILCLSLCLAVSASLSLLYVHLSVSLSTHSVTLSTSHPVSVCAAVCICLSVYLPLSPSVFLRCLCLLLRFSSVWHS